MKSRRLRQTLAPGPRPPLLGEERSTRKAEAQVNHAQTSSSNAARSSNGGGATCAGWSTLDGSCSWAEAGAETERWWVGDTTEEGVQ